MSFKHYRLGMIFCTTALVASVAMLTVEFGWAFLNVPFDSIQLRTERGWQKIMGDHPVVYRSPFRTFSVVHTDRGTYDANLSLDPVVDAELDRLAVQ